MIIAGLLRHREYLLSVSVLCLFSTLLRDVFHRILGISPLFENRPRFNERKPAQIQSTENQSVRVPPFYCNQHRCHHYRCPHHWCCHHDVISIIIFIIIVPIDNNVLEAISKSA